MIYTACEEYNFHWSPAEVKEFEEMWAAGIPIDYIARNFDRTVNEVFILALDRAERGHIKKRYGGILGLAVKGEWNGKDTHFENLARVL